MNLMSLCQTLVDRHSCPLFTVQFYKSMDIQTNLTTNDAYKFLITKQKEFHNMSQLTYLKFFVKFSVCFKVLRLKRYTFFFKKKISSTGKAFTERGMVLEQRQYKNDIVWLTSKLILKLPLFFTHLYDGRKSAPISKLIEVVLILSLLQSILER